MNVLFVLLLVVTQPVTPKFLYNGVEQGILVDVELPNEVDLAHVVLLNYDNTPLSDVEAITSGTHDLVSRIPEITNLTRAAWVQLIVDGIPVGAPVVIDPLLSRKVPVTEELTRPDSDTKYTKIVDWLDEAEEDGILTPLINGWRVYPAQDAVIKTSEGDIHLSLRPDVAPNTSWNFQSLSGGGFYRGSSFHRVVPLSNQGHPFVIQGGDPTGTGSGGPGYWLPIEKSELPHDFGVISMARAGDPDSAGSQFFLCLSREGTARLDGQYCAFGETVRGDDVIRAIAATPLSDPSMGKPAKAPRIENS